MTATASDGRLGPTPGPFFFGSRADLPVGTLIEVTRVAPLRPRGVRVTDAGTAYLHFTTAVDGATWRAQLLPGEEPGRIYRVEPTGSFESHPSGESGESDAPWAAYTWYRTTEPVRVTAEILDWEPHPESRIEGMRDRLAL